MVSNTASGGMMRRPTAVLAWCVVGVSDRDFPAKFPAFPPKV